MTRALRCRTTLSKLRLLFLLCVTLAGIVACVGRSAYSSPDGFLPAAPLDSAATKSPIKHVIVVIQENRSFDNFFATFPGADGTTTGKAKAMPALVAQACASQSPPQRVITKPTSIPLTKVSLIGAGFPGNFMEDTDLDHIHTGFDRDWNHGKMDGWDAAFNNPDGTGRPVCTYPYQYVDPAQIQPYWEMAKQYVLADHAFQTQGSGSFTAHQDLIAGGTQITSDEALIDNPTGFPWGCDAHPPDHKQHVPGSVTAIIKRGSNRVYPYAGPFPCLKYATLRDLLDAKKVSWKFYAVAVQRWNGAQDGATAGIWSAFDAIKAVRYSPQWKAKVTHSPLHIFTDISKNRLPAVSWITPDGANSDHGAECKKGVKPCQPTDTGPSWVASIVNAVGKSPYWRSTAIVILWDDWGGYYDHVPPPRPRDWQGGPGFRVPLLIVSPYVKPHVDHTVYFTGGSILRFIEENWDLGSLGTGDAHSASLGNAFDFSMRPRKFKEIPAKYSRAFFLNQTPSGVPPDTE
jgi:phospholipase C